MEVPTPRAWFFAIACTAALTGILGLMVAWLLYKGVGVWGNNIPVGWAWDITNFVFWIGIGHAGTPDLGDPLPLPPAVGGLDHRFVER